MRTIITLFILQFIVTTTSYSQEIKPPLGLDFGMSKAAFITKMDERQKESKSSGGRTEDGYSVIYGSVKFGEFPAKIVSGYFYKDKLYNLLVILNKNAKDRLLDAYRKKYGKPTGTNTWETNKGMIKFSDSNGAYADQIRIVFKDKDLEKDIEGMRRRFREKQEKDY
ncbi:hypothetical protein L0663_05230 [Dyadobacter sp. CY107]|uniref:hypothetical protein n=1 Tax=Dyadobacter fanqingshengii TaxID=2906443 RepID=UPI001F3D38AE|nr:hypothetical protein [Dyadobacter fanqingshengii]MCF2502770.1 hypothetical protein [Dyadobacter fanqingshengii]